MKYLWFFFVLIVSGSGCTQNIEQGQDNSDFFEKKYSCAAQAIDFTNYLKENEIDGLTEQSLIKICYSKSRNSCVAVVNENWYSRSGDPSGYTLKLIDVLTQEVLHQKNTTTLDESFMLENEAIDLADCAE